MEKPPAPWPAPPKPIRAKLELEFEPIRTPNFVRLRAAPSLPAFPSDGETAGDFAIPVRELSREALDALAAYWLTELYQKAGDNNPWQRSADLDR